MIEKISQICKSAQSCGCLRKERAGEMGRSNRIILDVCVAVLTSIMRKAIAEVVMINIKDGKRNAPKKEG